MLIDKKNFWEKKIIGWEDIRYNRKLSELNFFEKLINKTNNTLIFRLNTALKILEPLIKNKKVVEVGCGSGLIASEIIKAGASSYIGYDISEKAIERAIKLSKDNNSEHKTSFYAKPVMDMAEIEADYIFSLGLTDWLDDKEIEHLFKISRNCENLHSISEDNNSISQMLHKMYVFLSYGKNSKGYAPRYLKVEKISKLLNEYTDKQVYNFRHENMSFGLFLSTFQINNQDLLDLQNE